MAPPGVSPAVIRSMTGASGRGPAASVICVTCIGDRTSDRKAARRWRLTAHRARAAPRSAQRSRSARRAPRPAGAEVPQPPAQVALVAESLASARHPPAGVCPAGCLPNPAARRNPRAVPRRRRTGPSEPWRATGRSSRRSRRRARPSWPRPGWPDRTTRSPPEGPARRRWRPAGRRARRGSLVAVARHGGVQHHVDRWPPAPCVDLAGGGDRERHRAVRVSRGRDVVGDDDDHGEGAAGRSGPRSTAAAGRRSAVAEMPDRTPLIRTSCRRP